MPLYSFVCARGHVTDRLVPSSMKRGRARRVVCETCSGVATYDPTATFRGGVFVNPDVPEHWNVTIDRPVKSRRHLAELQKRHGFQDYEKIGKVPGNYGKPRPDTSHLWVDKPRAGALEDDAPIRIPADRG